MDPYDADATPEPHTAHIVAHHKGADNGGNAMLNSEAVFVRGGTVTPYRLDDFSFAAVRTTPNACDDDRAVLTRQISSSSPAFSVTNTRVETVNGVRMLRPMRVSIQLFTE